MYTPVIKHSNGKQWDGNYLSCPRSCVRDRVSGDRFRAFALVGLEFHQCVYFPSKNALENLDDNIHYPRQDAFSEDNSLHLGT